MIDYTRDDVAGGEHRYDVILDDIGGNRRLSHLRRALAPGGTLVIVGDETGGKWIGGFDRGFRAQVLSLFVGQKLGGFMATENTADLTALRDLVESGQAAPAVERTFSLSETPAAVRQVARAGPAQGRHRRVNRVAPTGGRAQS